MRIVITNDDGVFAPGIAALARGLRDAFGDQHELVVVAPMVDHSGAGAAVGPVYERESIPYEAVEIPGLSDVPVYGIDGPPALAVILACIEGFGPRPDLVVSGINHGTNAGRSALHSGTVGATLTGAQFGVRGLAVSIAWGTDPVPVGDPGLAGLRSGPDRGRLRSGHRPQPEHAGGSTGRAAGTAPRRSRHHRAHPVGPPRAHPRPGGRRPPRHHLGARSPSPCGAWGWPPTGWPNRPNSRPDTDAALLAEGWASLTPLTGVSEDRSDRGRAGAGRRTGHVRERRPRRPS